METIQRETSWNFIDKLLALWRSKFILPFLNKNAAVCDIGCGQEGKFLLSIADHIKEGYGFDFNLKITHSPKKNILLSSENFLECDKKFDVIVSLAVLEHLSYPQSVDVFLRGIYDRLHDGGVFIMTTPDKRSQWLLEFLAYKLRIINEEEIRDHKHYYNKKELVEFMKKHGFQNIKHKHFQFGLNNLVICRK